MKDDGETVNVVTEEDTQKVKDTVVNIANDVKEAAMNMAGQVKETPEEPAEDADFEQVVDDSEPKD